MSLLLCQFHNTHGQARLAVLIHICFSSLLLYHFGVVVFNIFHFVGK